LKREIRDFAVFNLSPGDFQVSVWGAEKQFRSVSY